jgi:hypothetical protein
MRSNAFERRMLFDRGSQRNAAPQPALASAPLLLRPSHRGLTAGRFHLHGAILLLRKIRAKPALRRLTRSPSPSRHIYKSLTMAVAFLGTGAFDGVRQHPIKVDGTFA